MQALDQRTSVPVPLDGQVAGRPLGDWAYGLGPAGRQTLTMRAAGALVDVHRVDWRAVGLDALLPPGGRHPSDLALDALVRAAATAGDPGLEARVRSLADQRPDDDDLVLLWGAARPDAMRFGPDLHVTCLTGWGEAALGHAEADLASFLARPVPGTPGREEFVAAYERLGGRPVRHLDWYEAMAAVRHDLQRSSRAALSGRC